MSGDGQPLKSGVVGHSEGVVFTTEHTESAEIAEMRKRRSRQPRLKLTWPTASEGRLYDKQKARV